MRVVRRGETDEPRVVDARDASLGCAGLAGDEDAGDLGRRTRAALDDELHHLVQLGRRLRLDRPAEHVRRRPAHKAAV